MTILKPTSLAIALSMIFTMPVMASSLVDFDGLQSGYVGTTAKQLTVSPSDLTHKLLINSEAPVRIIDQSGVTSNTNVATSTISMTVADPLLCVYGAKDSNNPSEVKATITTNNGATFNLQGLNDQATTAGVGVVHDPFNKTIQLNSQINNQCATFNADNLGGVYGDGKLFWHGFEDGGSTTPNLMGQALAVSINMEKRDGDAYDGLPPGYKRVVRNPTGVTEVTYDIEIVNRGPGAQTFDLLEYLPKADNAGYTFLNLQLGGTKWVGLQPVTLTCSSSDAISCANQPNSEVDQGVFKLKAITLPENQTVTFSMTRQMNGPSGAVVNEKDHAMVAVAAFVPNNTACNGNPDCRAIYSFIAS